MKYRLNSELEIEAIQYNANDDEIKEWSHGVINDRKYGTLVFSNDAGINYVGPEDWIIKVDGEYYMVDNVIFTKFFTKSC